MKKIVLSFVLVGALFLGGCSSAVNKLSKTGNALMSGNYVVTVYSGGTPVAKYFVKNSFVNQEVDTDGYFFFVEGNLVRVSGTITVEQQ